MNEVQGWNCVYWHELTSGQGEAICSNSTEPHAPIQKETEPPSSPTPMEIPYRDEELELEFDEFGDAILPLPEIDFPPDSPIRKPP